MPCIAQIGSSVCLLGLCTQASQSIRESRMDRGAEIKGQQASLQVGPRCEGEVWIGCIFTLRPLEGDINQNGEGKKSLVF